MKRKIYEIIIQSLTLIFIVGLFLIGLIVANEVIETLRAKENYQLANFNTIPYYLKAFSEYTLDEDDDKQVLELMCGIADEVNANNNDNVAIAVYSTATKQFMCNEKNDPLLAQLIHSIKPGDRKIKTNYDYYNSEYGNYLLLIRIKHEGIFNILLINGLIKKILISSLLFVILSIALILFLQNNKNLKYRKIAGIIFIAIWIGSITITSAIDINKQQETIVNQEVEHITSLIEFYYYQDLIEHSDEIEDRRQFAQDNINKYLVENGNIASIELNDNYNDNLDSLDGCLTVTINQNIQNNKRIEFILSALLFLILAILLYDKLSERMITANIVEDDYLTKLDKNIITIELINIIGNCLTWSLMLPRLMEVSSINFGINNNDYVASIYSLGIIITTIISILSSSINRLFKNIKYFFLFTFFSYFVGIGFFALIDNLILNTIAYFIICVGDGISGLLIYFYAAGCDSKERKDSLLLKCRSTLNIGQSIGIIVGGVFGSIFKYRHVLLIGATIIAISTVLLMLTKSRDYSQATILPSEKRPNIKDLLNKKESFFFVLFIIVPLAFYDVYLDYKFPIDIINLGLTTIVISFVSMSGRLISAYCSHITFPKLKNKVGLSMMTYIYLIGCIVLMMTYQFNASLIMIIIVTAAMGLLDSFGTLSYRERFIEISAQENINENDSNVIVKIGDKFGSSIGPSLIGLFNNAVVLPLTMLISFIIYKLLNKKEAYKPKRN